MYFTGPKQPATCISWSVKHSGVLLVWYNVNWEYILPFLLFYNLFSLWCIHREKHYNNVKSIFTYRHQQIHDWKWFAWLHLLKSSTIDHLQTRAGKTFQLKKGWDCCFHLGWTENLGFWWKFWHSKLKNSYCGILGWGKLNVPLQRKE